MASLIIEHGVMPRYQAKKVTNYRYTENSNSQTVNYVYSAPSSVINTKGWGIDETITDNSIKIETLCNIMGNTSTEAQEGGGMIAIGSLQTYFPYQPHEEKYCSNCVPYYENGVQVGWQKTAESTETSIVVLDGIPWFGYGGDIIYDRNENIFCIEWELRGYGGELPLVGGGTVINDSIQYVGRSVRDVGINKTIYGINGNKIYTGWPDPSNVPVQRTRTLYFNGPTNPDDPAEIEKRKGRIAQIFSERKTSVTISTSPTAQAITSTDSGMVWALTGADKWSTSMSEQSPFNDNFPSYLPLILVPYTGTEDVKLYDMQLTEEIE